MAFKLGWWVLLLVITYTLAYAVTTALKEKLNFKGQMTEEKLFNFLPIVIGSLVVSYFFLTPFIYKIL